MVKVGLAGYAGPIKATTVPYGGRPQRGIDRPGTARASCPATVSGCAVLTGSPRKVDLVFVVALTNGVCVGLEPAGTVGMSESPRIPPLFRTSFGETPSANPRERSRHRGREGSLASVDVDLRLPFPPTPGRPRPTAVDWRVGSSRAGIHVSGVIEMFSG
jgi:hypothetical protein